MASSSRGKRTDDNSLHWQQTRDNAASSSRNAGAKPTQSSTKTNTSDTQGRSQQSQHGSGTKPSAGTANKTQTNTSNTQGRSQQTPRGSSGKTQVSQPLTNRTSGVNLSPASDGRGNASADRLSVRGAISDRTPLELIAEQAYRMENAGRNTTAKEYRYQASRLNDNSAAAQALRDRAGSIRKLSATDQLLPDEQRQTVAAAKNRYDMAADEIATLKQYKAQMASYGMDTSEVDAYIARYKNLQGRFHDAADLARSSVGYTGGIKGNTYDPYQLGDQLGNIAADSSHWENTARGNANDTFDVDENRNISRTKWVDDTPQLKEILREQLAYADQLERMGMVNDAGEIRDYVSEVAAKQQIPSSWDVRAQDALLSAGNRVAGSLRSFGSMAAQATENMMGNTNRNDAAYQLKTALDNAGAQLRRAQASGDEAGVRKWQGEVDRLNALLYGDNQPYDENGNLREEWLKYRGTAPAWHSESGVDEKAHEQLTRSRELLNEAKRGLSGEGQFALETAAMGLENIPTFGMYALNPALGAAYMLATVEGEMADSFSHSVDSNGNEYNNGMSAQEAMARALPYAAVEAGTEALGDSAILNFISKRGSLGIGGVVARSFLTEGAEEGAAGVLDYGLDYAYGNPAVREQSAGQVLGDIYKQGLQGGIIGAALGGGGAVAANRISGQGQQLDPEWWKNVDTRYTQSYRDFLADGDNFGLADRIVPQSETGMDYLNFLSEEAARTTAQRIGSEYVPQARPERADPRTWGEGMNDLISAYRDGWFTDKEWQQAAMDRDIMSALEETADRAAPAFDGNADTVRGAQERKIEWAKQTVAELAAIQRVYEASGNPESVINAQRIFDDAMSERRPFAKARTRGADALIEAAEGINQRRNTAAEDAQSEQHSDLSEESAEELADYYQDGKTTGRDLATLQGVFENALENEEPDSDYGIDVRSMAQKKKSPATLKQTEQNDAEESVDVRGMAKPVEKLPTTSAQTEVEQEAPETPAKPKAKKTERKRSDIPFGVSVSTSPDGSYAVKKKKRYDSAYSTMKIKGDELSVEYEPGTKREKSEIKGKGVQAAFTFVDQATNEEVPFDSLSDMITFISQSKPAKVSYDKKNKTYIIEEKGEIKVKQMIVVKHNATEEQKTEEKPAEEAAEPEQNAPNLELNPGISEEEVNRNMETIRAAAEELGVEQEEEQKKPEPAATKQKQQEEAGETETANDAFAHSPTTEKISISVEPDYQGGSVLKKKNGEGYIYISGDYAYLEDDMLGGEHPFQYAILSASQATAVFHLVDENGRVFSRDDIRSINKILFKELISPAEVEFYPRRLEYHVSRKGAVLVEAKGKNGALLHGSQRYKAENSRKSPDSVDEKAAPKKPKAKKKPDAVMERAVKREAAAEETGEQDTSGKVTSDKRWGVTDEDVTRNEGNEQSGKTITEIVDWIQTQLGVNVTSGNMRGKAKSVNGFFMPKNNGVRIREENNLPTVTHELGHWLDNQYGEEFGAFSDMFSDEAKRELVENTDVSDRYSEDEVVFEGFAEFLRELLKSKSSAAKKFPAAYAEFYNNLTEEDRDNIDYLADMVNDYMTSDADYGKMVRRQNDRVDGRTKKQQRQEKMHQFYQNWVDSNHGIELLTRETGDRNPYILATNAAYAAQRAGAILTSNMYSLDGSRYAGRSLKAVLEGNGIKLDSSKKSQKMYDDFGIYLVAKHGPERLERGRVAADDRLNDAEAMKAKAAELEAQYPHFVEAARDLYQFQRDFLYEYAVMSGLVSQETADKWQEQWEFYVPFQRYMRDKKGTATAAQRNFANQASQIYRFKGSGRDIIHPVDSIVGFVTRMTTASILNDVMVRLTKSAEKHGLDASFMEKVPSPMEETSVHAKSYKQRVSEFAKGWSDELGEENTKAFKEGLNAIHAAYQKELAKYTESWAGILEGDAEAEAFTEGLAKLDEYISGFRMANSSKRSDTVTVMKNGKPEFWKVNDGLLLESIANMHPKTLDGVLGMAAVATRFMTSNITGRNIVWSVLSNTPRDIVTALTFGHMNAAELIGGMLKNYYNFVQYSRGKKTSDCYREFLAMGGGRVTSWNSDINNVKKTMQKTKWRDDPKQFFGDCVNALDYISAMIESGPRYAEYEHMKRKGATAQEAFYAAMDITTNFAKRGIYGSQMNAVVPFGNASVQGIDKFSRWMRATDIEDPVARKKASASRILMWTASSMAVAAFIYGLNNFDDDRKEDYQNLSNYMKNNFFMIPIGDGKFYAMPKPREIAVLESFFESAMEYAEGGNPDAFKEYFQYATDNLAPPVIAPLLQRDINGIIGDTFIGPLSAVNANKDFLGNPIESPSFDQSNTPLNERFNSNTSRAAHWICNNLTKDKEYLPDVVRSPLKLDYLLKQVLGGFWEGAKAIWPIGDEYKRDTFAEYTAEGVFKRYLGNKAFKDSLYSTDIPNWLYDYQKETAMKGAEGYGDFDAEYEAKVAKNYTDFFGNFSKLTKNAANSDETRQTRRLVIRMIADYKKSVQNGVMPQYLEDLREVAREQTLGKSIGDMMVTVMDSTIKDANNEKHLLTGSQYYDMQTKANSYFQQGAEAILANQNFSANEKAQALAKLKDDVSARARGEMLQAIGAPTSATTTNAAGKESVTQVDKYASYENISIGDLAAIQMMASSQPTLYDPRTKSAVDNTHGAYIAKAILDYGLDLDQEETIKLMSDMGVGKTVIGWYKSGVLEQTLEGLESQNRMQWENYNKSQQ